MKRPRAILTILAATMVLLTVACQSGDEATPDIGQQIEANLHILVTNPDTMAFSNPEAYIEGNPEAYAKLVDSGEAGLVYMRERIENSDQDGLEEWILARACSDILREEERSSEP